jgi:hypothetical protein
MSVAALPPEVAWSLVGYTLGPRGQPLRTKDEKYARVLDLIRFSSTCRVARELYGDLRFKALMICVAPGREAHIGFPIRRFVYPMEETYGNLVKAPDAWREDRAVVLAAVQLSGDALRTVDSSYLTDKEIVLAAIKNEDAKTALLDLSQKIYRLIPEELQLDEEVARAGCRRGGHKGERRRLPGALSRLGSTTGRPRPRVHGCPALLPRNCTFSAQLQLSEPIIATPKRPRALPTGRCQERAAQRGQYFAPYERHF